MKKISSPIKLIQSKISSVTVPGIASSEIKAISDGYTCMVIQRDIYSLMINQEAIKTKLKHVKADGHTCMELTKGEVKEKYPNLLDLFGGHINRLKLISFPLAFKFLEDSYDPNSVMIVQALAYMYFKLLKSPSETMKNANYQAESDLYESKINSLEFRNSKLSRDIENAKYDTKKLNELNFGLQKDNHKYRSDIKEYNDKIARLNSELQDIRAHLAKKDYEQHSRTYHLKLALLGDKGDANNAY